MAELKNSHRCVNDILGYCAINKVGLTVSNPNGTVSYTGGGECEKNWQECEHHIKNSELFK